MPSRFTLRQLEYFQAVAEHGSIAAASERINVSSPSISAAVSQLEAEFGIQLFVRKHAQGLSLTPGGQQFLDQARSVMAEAGRLAGLANNISNSVQGPLRVGCLSTFAQIQMPRLRRDFVEAHPRVEFQQFERHQADLFEELRHARLDVALTYDLAIPQDLAFQPLVSLPPYVLLPTQHALAKRQSIAVGDLLAHPMVLLDLPLSGAYFLSLFSETGAKPKIAERARDLFLMHSLVANGFGFSLANIQPMPRAAPDGRPLHCILLKDPVRALQLGLLTVANAKPTQTVRAFMSHCSAAMEAARSATAGDTLR